VALILFSLKLVIDFSKKNLLCGFLAITLISCDSKTGLEIEKKAPQPFKEVAMEEKTSLDPRDQNPQIELSPATSSALTIIFQSAAKVVSEKKSLFEEEVSFGQGTDHSPKGEGPVRLRYYTKQVAGDNISTSFRRIDEKNTWNEAEIYLAPRNFPIGVYRMNFDGDFFKGLVLEQKDVEDRPNEQIKRVNVFRFKSDSKVAVRFEARVDVSSLTENYPASFHKVFISRAN
jgi:hypothetical protein